MRSFTNTWLQKKCQTTIGQTSKTKRILTQHYTESHGQSLHLEIEYKSTSLKYDVEHISWLTLKSWQCLCGFEAKGLLQTLLQAGPREASEQVENKKGKKHKKQNGDVPDKTDLTDSCSVFIIFGWMLQLQGSCWCVFTWWRRCSRSAWLHPTNRAKTRLSVEGNFIPAMYWEWQVLTKCPVPPTVHSIAPCVQDVSMGTEFRLVQLSPW